MAAYRELAAFALMASDLDKATQQQLGRGLRMQELLKQPQYQPMELQHQVLVIFAGTNGFADKVSPTQMSRWQVELISYMEASHPEIVKDIIEKKSISDATRVNLLKALDSFRNTWQE
jgi:F-type H+-transporting ATPase subunit alpha